jgi:hypothetical protein
MTKSLNETVLLNILTELNMAKAKRMSLIEAELATDRIDARIAVLEQMIENQRVLMADRKLRDEMGLE